MSPHVPSATTAVIGIDDKPRCQYAPKAIVHVVSDEPPGKKYGRCMGMSCEQDQQVAGEADLSAGKRLMSHAEDMLAETRVEAEYKGNREPNALTGQDLAAGQKALRAQDGASIAPVIPEPGLLTHLLGLFQETERNMMAM